MTRPELVHRLDCRGCGAAALEKIIELGPTPLANSFLQSESEFAAERAYPLDLYFCDNCSLLQLLDVVDPEVMFRHYLYVTGTSTTIAAHNREYSRTLRDLLGLTRADLVAEVASNDGSLLRCFHDHDIRTLGIEPARNLAASARASGIDTINEFFSSKLGADLAARGPARVVIGNNVLAHVDDPADFLDGCRQLVSDNGLVTIEVPYVGELLERVEYDTVYHEHLSYFSVTSLLRLCERVGLWAVRIDHVPVHGGSLRLYLSRSAGAHGEGPRAMEAAERRPGGAADAARYRRFAEDVRAHRTAIVGLLTDLKARGARLAAYGAPAKGNTLLNYCRIGRDLVPFTVDKNPLKVGLYTPGMHIPVRPVGALMEGADAPDTVLILAWNFAEEIMQQQAAFRARGGRFVVPIPAPRLI
ncbi:MAG TPA: class I SAM-dependent methyltransferase [Vicinamibacterales bacterium]|nr:class I SAM-dependent methyltransferase [Vicinamibacterales bacterium]